ncbi:MAG: hypothetical protein DIU68_019885 [Chloroflexota bacterium]
MFTIRWTIVSPPFVKQVEQLPVLFGDAMQAASQKVKPLFDENMRKEPPPLTDADYPLAWTSLRQARFVKRKLRLEGNLPYRRSHLLSTSWQFLYRQHRFRAEIEMNNPDPKASYVLGRANLENPTQDQQRFHAMNGWKAATPEVQRIAAEFLRHAAEGFEARVRRLNSG